MANPQIKLKRSSVALKRPTLGILTTGEFAINSYDGSLYTVVDTGGVGIGTTVSNLTPWVENYGAESITYQGIQTSGGGITTDYSSVTLSGLTPTGFNTTYTRQSNGFVLDTGTVGSGNALFDTDSSYYYYVEDGDTTRMLIYSESDNNWKAVKSAAASPSTEYNVLTTSNLSPSSFNQTYVRQATGFILDTGTVASGNAIFRTDSSHYYYVASTGSDAEDRIVIWSEEDNAWLTVFDFNDPDFREGNISNGQALGSSFIFSATLTSNSDTFNSRNVPDADDADVTYDTTRDYSSLTLDASLSDFDGNYTRQSFKANLDTGTVSSGNALFNSTSDYWWFLKDGDNSKMIIFDSVTGQWTYVGRTGADFSSAANNTAVGSANAVESQTITSVQYESNANQPNANYSEITYDALTGTDYSSVSNNDALGGPSGITSVTVTSGKTTADSRFVPTASGSIVYATTNVAITTSKVGVATFTTGGNLILAGTVNGRYISTDGSNQDDLQTLTGVSAGSTTFGTFSGTTISDNKNLKTVLQELETAVDNVVGGNSGAASVLVSSTDTDATFFPTFVGDNNGSDTQEAFKTDAGITYNPSTNILSVSGSVVANVTGNLTGNVTGDVTGTATTATNLANAANITTGTISNDRLPSTITKDLTGDVTGDLTGNADTASQVKTQAANANVDLNITFVQGNNASATAESVFTDSTFTYNPSTNVLKVGGSGHIESNVIGNIIGDVTGTADMATNLSVTNISSTNTDFTLTMTDGSNTSTGRAFGMDSDLTYNPSTNTLTAGTIVGNLTGNVTGNTSGTAGGLTGSPSITVTDITAVGNVSIAGTLTYEDVTSIDAVGLITARTGVRVTTGGLTVSAGGANITGGITGDLTGNVVGNLTGDVTGTATTATNLANAANITTGTISNDRLPATITKDLTGDVTGNVVGNVTGNLTGNAGTATSLATARTIHGVSFDGTSDIDLSEVIQDTVGAMFSGNTETGITVTYEDGDGTIDLVVGNLNQDTTGTAALAEGLTGTPNIIVGVVTASTLDISGDVDIDGTLEADAITIDGITLSETIADTVGGMVSGNTESGITVTYDDSDNTLDFVIGTLNQDTTGNAGTATSLATARTIGGVSFDGTSNINLPGVNQSGNQNTTGNAATATALETSRTIGGVSFDGTGDINLPGVNQSGNQNTSGNAATATALETARTIGGVSFDGTSDINLPGVNAAGNQNTTGTSGGLTGAPSITVTDITAVGNVSIAGTLTYEDVNNVDSVGLVTARTGVRVTTGGVVVSNGGLDVTGVSTFNDDIDLQDNDKLLIGTGDDLQIYHDGSHSYISDEGQGNLKFRSNNFRFTNTGESKTSATFVPAGSVDLYYDNTKKLETTNGGVLVTGILTATSFEGDGSNLTGLPVSGIEVFNNGTSVGAGATKIDFGEGVSISPVVSGIATVTTSSNTGVLTTTSTSQVAISTFSTATYSSGLFTISVENGGNVSLAQVNVVTTGSEVFVSEFGNVNSGPGLSTFSAHVSGSNVELLAYPTYSTSTTLSVNKKLFALGYGAGITTNASYSTSWKIIDTFSATAHKAVVYEIEAKRGSQILISKINLVHDGTEVYLSEFGTLGTSNITQFTGSISGSTVRLQAKANSSTTTDYTVRRTFF